MHAAKTAAERAAFVEFQVASFPDAQILGNRVAVVTDNLKGVGILRDKSGSSLEHQHG
jgi:hypothetical protein